MKLKTEATQVAQRTAALLRSDRRTPAATVEPIWYRVVLSNPPSHQILPRLRQLETQLEQDRFRYTREAKTGAGFYVTRNKQRYNTNAKHLYRLPKLSYEEDRIRHLFYTNHPWELARPRNAIENEGAVPLARLDWSTIYQPTHPLSGESVVQRTLWLAKQPEYKSKHGSDWFSAFEQARVEFYRLRMREFTEKQLAQEEAIMMGAVMGPSAWESYSANEQRYVEKYVAEATEASKEILARRARMTEDDSADAETDASKEASAP